MFFRLWLGYVFRPVNYSTKKKKTTKKAVPFVGSGREKKVYGKLQLKTGRLEVRFSVLWKASDQGFVVEKARQYTSMWSDRMKVVKPMEEETSRDIIRNNQSVENSGVAFVKGANERNEFFEKINKH